MLLDLRDVDRAQTDMLGLLPAVAAQDERRSSLMEIMDRINRVRAGELLTSPPKEQESAIST